jgi:hypothetical protein
MMSPLQRDLLHLVTGQLAIVAGLRVTGSRCKDRSRGFRCSCSVALLGVLVVSYVKILHRFTQTAIFQIAD